MFTYYLIRIFLELKIFFVGFQNLNWSLFLKEVVAIPEIIS